MVNSRAYEGIVERPSVQETARLLVQLTNLGPRFLDTPPPSEPTQPPQGSEVKGGQ